MNYNNTGDNKFTGPGYDQKATKGDCFPQTHAPLPRKQFWQKKKKKSKTKNPIKLESNQISRSNKQFTGVTEERTY